ncbi:DEAD/DEAH box helicase, partial [Vibrio mediterranei]
EIRTQNQNAGGLVVASSVQHAQEIKNILLHKYQQTVSIVTYRHEAPLAEIECFRKNSTQWIVSVGMISEGTDIPRLQVCCHISSVKTELYFRQVLGRILRV